MALEAHLAAQLIQKDPWHTRGGPWLGLKLTKEDKEEVKAASRCKTLMDLQSLGESLGPSSRLQQHLKGLQFRPVTAPTGPAVARDKVVELEALEVKIKMPRMNAKVSRKRSGTNFSGAYRRFHKLPVPMAVCKRPASRQNKCLRISAF